MIGKFFDISPIISQETAVFPGDTIFKMKSLLDFSTGDNLRLTQLTTTPHIGAHADAPSHYAAHGKSIEDVALERYLGPAQMIDLSQRILPRNPRKLRLETDDFKNIVITQPRVLIKTLTFPNPNQWRDDFLGLGAPVIDLLHSKGVVLVGIDTPSIDPANDKILESHNAVAKNGMSVLEGLVLDSVSTGRYFLIALPLKIAKCDASPVRAILLEKDL
jgi:arylformamidase